MEGRVTLLTFAERGLVTSSGPLLDELLLDMRNKLRGESALYEREVIRGVDDRKHGVLNRRRW